MCIDLVIGFVRWVLMIFGCIWIWYVIEMDVDGVFYVFSMGIYNGVDCLMVYKF